MATDKVFKVFGVSKLNGEYKVRFANDIMRIKVLAKHDHTDIRLTEFDNAMSKYDGIKALATHPDYADAAAQAAISEYLEEKAPKTPKAKAAPKAKAEKAPKNTKASREMQALKEAAAVAKADAALEDAPF